MADLSLDGLTLLTPIPGAAETYIVSAATDYRGNVNDLFVGRTLSATVALGIRSSGAAFDLQIASSEVLTANRALNVVLGDAARTLTVGASASVSGTNTGDQTSVSGNAGTVTTNANLTGHITSSGNAAVLGSFTVAQLSTAISDANISGTNTGDQTSVSGNAGTATALATARAIYGNNFDGTAALTQVIGSAFGGTGNGFTKFSGPTTAEKTFTLPDASATIARTDAGQSFTGVQSFPTNSIGVTSTDGLVLSNATAATAGTQQWSPRLRLTGQGWKSDATAASQPTDWIVENRPLAGASSPSTSLYFSTQINTGGYATVFSVNSNGPAGNTSLNVNSPAAKNANISFQANLVNKWYLLNQGSSDLFLLVNSDASGNAITLAMSQAGNLKIAGTAVRGTTEGTNHLDIFNGTAPVGTLANGISLYSTSGELRVMDAGGTATLLSPHDRETGEWIYFSKNTLTGQVLRVDMERMMRALNEKLGGGFIQEYIDRIN